MKNHHKITLRHVSFIIAESMFVLMLQKFNFSSNHNEDFTSGAIEVQVYVTLLEKKLQQLEGGGGGGGGHPFVLTFHLLSQSRSPYFYNCVLLAIVTSNILTCTHAPTHTHTCMSSYVHPCACTHTHMCACMHTCIHNHMIHNTTLQTQRYAKIHT